MTTFDHCIDEVSAYIEEMRRQEIRVRVCDFPGACADSSRALPIRSASDGDRGIILRGDTFVELGNPQVGSCSALLWTAETSLVHDGRITLLGPDVPESSGASLPFGQVLLVGGPDLDEGDHERLQQAQHVSDRIEGYMVRSTSENIWGRVSKQAAARGFDCEALGGALITLVRRDVPSASAVEVLFVTTSKGDVARLAGICTRAKQIGGDILKETWKARGYDVDCNFDCGSCVDESVCDDIRAAIVASRKKKKAQQARERS